MLDRSATHSARIRFLIRAGPLQVVGLKANSIALPCLVLTFELLHSCGICVDAKIGFWQDLYKGPYGRFVFGVELGYLKRTSFPGIGGVVSTDNTVAFTSLRYFY